MKMSEQINELVSALTKARKTFKIPQKTSENPFFQSHYADLAECLDACIESLSGNGLAIIQMPATSGSIVEKNNMLVVTTMLAHTSGQWISEELALAPVKSDPQSYGSACSYARRYALMAFLNMAPDDDDGNEASKPVAAKTAPQKEAPKETVVPTGMISEPQRKRFFAICKNAGHENQIVKDWLSLAHNIQSSKEIPIGKYEEICKQAEYSVDDMIQYVNTLRQGVEDNG